MFCSHAFVVACCLFGWRGFVAVHFLHFLHEKWGYIIEAPFDLLQVLGVQLSFPCRDLFHALKFVWELVENAETGFYLDLVQHASLRLRDCLAVTKFIEKGVRVAQTLA